MVDANYYEILGVTPDATPEEIRSAYLDLAKRVHPDQGGNQALFRSVNSAYETLNDPTRRATYDRNNFEDPLRAPADATAPGWRRTDNQSRADQPGRANSDSRVHDESSSDDSTREPPPNPPPGPPPTSSTGDGGSAGVTPPAQAALNNLRVRAATNPSVALLTAGLATLVIALRIGGVTAHFLVLGLLAAVAGFVGVLGRKKAARRAAIERADIVRIDEMTGVEFELRLRVAFQHVGYTVYHVGGRGDYGADLVLDLPGSRTVVQAKRWNNTVGPGAVQEVAASRAHYNAQHAIVITTSTFTKAAIKLARSNAVEMWDRARLIRFLAAQQVGPPRTGITLLGEELRAGAPRVLRGGFVVLVTLAAMSAASSKSRRRGRR